MWFRTCARYDLILETFTSKICSNHIMEVKKNDLQVQKVSKQILEGEQEILKKLIKWKRSFLTYLEKRNCRKLSEVSLFCLKSPERFKEKDAVKNAVMESLVAAALEFVKTGNYFYFNSFVSLFETVLLIWLNPLGSGVHSLYYQPHLIYPQYHTSICLLLCRSSRSEMFLTQQFLKFCKIHRKTSVLGFSF